MNAEQWTQVMYRALGVPEAVTRQADMAALKLQGKAKGPQPAPGSSALVADLEQARTHAEEELLQDLPDRAEEGELDRLLCGVETLEETAKRLAWMGRGGPIDAEARRLVLLYLLPLVLQQVGSRTTGSGSLWVDLGAGHRDPGA